MWVNRRKVQNFLLLCKFSFVTENELIQTRLCFNLEKKNLFKKKTMPLSVFFFYRIEQSPLNNINIQM